MAWFLLGAPCTVAGLVFWRLVRQPPVFVVDVVPFVFGLLARGLGLALRSRFGVGEGALLPSTGHEACIATSNAYHTTSFSPLSDAR